MLRLVMADGEVFEGQTHLDVVRAMKGATMFSDRKGVLEYVDAAVQHAREIEKVELAVDGQEIDARCASFLDELQRAKLAVLEEAPDKGASALSRLVQLCADVRFGGDVATAWPVVQRQMRFNEDERRLIERELGLADAKV